MQEHKVNIIKKPVATSDIIDIQEEKLIDIAKLNPTSTLHKPIKIMIGSMVTQDMITIRTGGPYSGKAIFLPASVNWVITTDRYNNKCLIPYKK